MLRAQARSEPSLREVVLRRDLRVRNPLKEAVLLLPENVEIASDRSVSEFGFIGIFEDGEQPAARSRYANKYGRAKLTGYCEALCPKPYQKLLFFIRKASIARPAARRQASTVFWSCDLITSSRAARRAFASFVPAFPRSDMYATSSKPSRNASKKNVNS